MGGVREGSGSVWHLARVTGSEGGHWQPCSSPSNSWEASFGRMAGSIRPCCGTLLAAASNRLQSAAWGARLAGRHEDGEQSLDRQQSRRCVTRGVDASRSELRG